MHIKLLRMSSRQRSDILIKPSQSGGLFAEAAAVFSLLFNINGLSRYIFPNAMLHLVGVPRRGDY